MFISWHLASWHLPSASAMDPRSRCCEREEIIFSIRGRRPWHDGCDCFSALWTCWSYLKRLLLVLILTVIDVQKLQLQITNYRLNVTAVTNYKLHFITVQLPITNYFKCNSITAKHWEYIITSRSRVVVQNVFRNWITHFWWANRGSLSFFFTYKHTHRQTHIQTNFHLTYRSQIWTESNELMLITRGFRCRCAFWGYRRRSIIFRGPAPKNRNCTMLF